jgi:hypothetical protein
VRSLSTLAAAAALLGAAGCVDTKACHNAIVWKPCAGEAAEAGASGTPPSITDLELPTCAYLDSPTVSGTLEVTDPDGDAQVAKATFAQGVRTNESEAELDDAERSGNDWSGPFAVVVVGSSGGMLMEGTYDARVKVTDRAGGQSVPFCNSIALVR